ncbi:hypothetical protein JCM10296v2_004817 [Rhodotorula toruloides]
MDKPSVQHLERHLPEGVHVHASYAVDETNTPVTVFGTMGQDPDEKQSISWKIWIIVALCCLAQMQNTFLDIAPAANAYTPSQASSAPTRRSVSGSYKRFQGVPSIVTGPIVAIISDVYGRRYVVLFAWLLFCVGAIVAVTANNVNGVIAGQALNGVAAGISGIMYAIASEVTPSVYRAWVQSVVNLASSTAAILALIAMTAASQADAVNGWRWVFRTMLLFDGILLFGFGFFYHPPPRTATRHTLLQKLASLDWIGYFLLIAGLVPLLMSFAWSSDSTIGWHDPHSYACVAVGFAEWKGTETGFLDHRLFQHGRNFPLSLFLIAVEGSLFYLVNNIYSSEVNGLWAMPGTMDASARLLPFFLVIFAVAPVMSWYVTKYKDLKWPLCAGLLCFAVATIGFAMSGTNGNMATAFNAVGGIGFTAPLTLLITLVQLSTPPLFIGIASALTISVRTLGGVVGYAIAEAIYGSLTNTQIPENILKAVVPMGFNPQYLGPLIGFLLSGQGLAAIPNITGPMIGAASAALTETQAHAYKIVWFAFLPGSILAASGCAMFHNPKERMNWVTDAPLDTKNIGAHNNREAHADSESSAEQEKVAV